MIDFVSSLQKLAFIALLCTHGAYAAESVVADGLGMQITSSDLQADAQRIPPDIRKSTLSSADNVQQLASNLFVRRALAAQAEHDGLANDPGIVAALKLARDRVLSDAQLNKINEANKPSDAGLDAYAMAYYKANSKQFELPEQLRARHILITGKDAVARTKAEKILADIKGGADFGAMAQANSADASNAPKGGDLGFFARGKMAPAFEEAAFGLKSPGDVSEIIETQFGLHIIKLEERKIGALRPFEEVREQLRQEATNKILQEARAAEAQRLAASARFDKAAIDAFAASQR